MTPQYTVRAQLPNRGIRSYLKGPRSAADVRKLGYAFTEDATEAWPFSTAKQAEQKAKVVARHMGWGDGPMSVSPI